MTCRTRARHPAGGQVGHRAAGGREIVERHVHAAARQIVLDVADDVGELQRDAEIQRVVARLRIAAAEDPDTDQADRRRDAVAILQQIVECLIPRRVEIHRHAVDHVGKSIPWQVEAGNERLQPASLKRLRNAALEASSQLGAPETDRLARLLSLLLCLLRRRRRRPRGRSPRQR